MFAQHGLKPTRGLLLVGPSGSGKTTLLRYASVLCDFYCCLP